MKGLFFSANGLAVFLLIGFALILFLAYKKFPNFFSTSPLLLFSNTQDLTSPKPGWRVQLASLPRWLLIASLIFFLIAFIDPHLDIAKQLPPSQEETIPPSEGIAIYLVLDHSSSMAKEIPVSSGSGRRKNRSRLDLLKEVTSKFVKEDTSNLIGLVAFARSAQVLVPLTLDHQAILEELAKLSIPTKDQDGTAMGYAIFKTVNLIAATRYYAKDLIGNDLPAYDIKSSAIILVTDGLQAPNPLDLGNKLRTMGLEEAAKYAQENHVRLYIINIDPRLTSSELTPHRNLMQRITEFTGGKLYIMDSSVNLNDIYTEINSLEKSVIPGQEKIVITKTLSRDEQPHLYDRFSIYPYLIALGLGIFFLAVLLQTTLLRTVP